ncbi:MAG: tRNA (adenosine(37)-N6)-threonylcarbamoyltransferase complex transferase subunit TsaD [Patescibacteria group bacterium]|nr:tRNA (adenosine(37)-N6)-threonylcarbamoyltransferase complex transferase subunit TsaD [Patescibacteria group bacterium]
MRILGIETSCDETAASVIEANSKDKQTKIISNLIASSLPLHSKTGGIIPEVAAREQIKYMIPVINNALKNASSTPGVEHQKMIDAIAVTVGPGLIGSLLVGVEAAKTLSYVWKKPIIPVNHLIGHVYANFIKASREQNEIEFPALVLIVSGGHTDLVLMKNHGNLKLIGGTLDDAAGEAFDKIARLLNLSYPGGPAIENAAKKGNENTFNFPRPMINSRNFDFSFSGLKAAVLREVQKMKKIDQKTVSNISASVQKAIIDVLIDKTLKAAENYKAKSILISGGVSANELLRKSLEIKSYDLRIKFFAPEKFLCTDNAAMIATAAFFNYNPIHWSKINVNPELYFK